MDSPNTEHQTDSTVSGIAQRHPIHWRTGPERSLLTGIPAGREALVFDDYRRALRVHRMLGAVSEGRVCVGVRLSASERTVVVVCDGKDTDEGWARNRDFLPPWGAVIVGDPEIIGLAERIVDGSSRRLPLPPHLAV